MGPWEGERGVGVWERCEGLGLVVGEVASSYPAQYNSTFRGETHRLTSLPGLDLEVVRDFCRERTLLMLPFGWVYISLMVAALKALTFSALVDRMVTASGYILGLD